MILACRLIIGQIDLTVRKWLPSCYPCDNQIPFSFCFFNFRYGPRLKVLSQYTHASTRWQKTPISLHYRSLCMDLICCVRASLHPHDCISSVSARIVGVHQEDQSTCLSTVKQLQSVRHCP